MKQIYFYIFIILAISNSCIDKKESKSIDDLIVSINAKDDAIITESPVFTKMRYVKLETKEECLLENVTKVIPFENKLYILTSLGQGNIFIFDNNGAFIKKIKRGDGPEDIIYPTDIAINSNKRHLLILDYYRNIKEYDLDGNFIQKISMKEPFLALESIGDDFLLFDPNTRSKSNYYIRYLTEKLKSKELFQKPLKGKLFYSPNFFTKINEDKVLVSCILSDTIFYITKTQKELLPYMILDFHDQNANKKDRLNRINDIGEYLRNAENMNYITGPSDVGFINDNIFFTLRSGKDFYYVNYIISNNEILLHKTLIEGLPNIYVSSGRTNKEVIFTIDIPWLMEYFQENPQINSDMIKHLKEECNNEDDNPILIFASF